LRNIVRVSQGKIKTTAVDFCGKESGKKQR